MKKTKTKTTKSKPKERTTKKKISNFYKLFLLIFAIIVFAITTALFGVTIACCATILYAMVIFVSLILDVNPKHSKVRKVFKVFVIIGLTGGIFAVVCFIAFFTYIAVTAPAFDTSKLEKQETSILYDNQGSVLQTLGTEKRENITYDELPEVLINAIVATEDSKFFQHNGFDAARFVKATIGQALGRSESGGASTITMQISKKALTSEDVSIKRKFTDIYLAIFKFEKAFTKQEIFEYYVNIPFLGSNSSGVEQASRTYFGKHAYELSLPEASLIAGLFQAPTSYNPYAYPEAAKERQETVLNLMVRHGYITKEEKKIVQKIDIEDLLLKDTTESVSAYQSYIDMVVNELIDEFGIDPYEIPVLVYTNLDRAKQDKLYDVFTGKSYKWPNKTIQSGVAAIESNTGKIIAVGGGRFRTGALQQNYATDIKRQVGSTAKPLFDYAPGIEYNNWSTGQTFIDEPYSYSGSSSKIVNYDGAYKGAITLRYALRDSRNVPAVKAFQQVDNKKIKDFVTSVGIEPEIDANGYLHEAHALGAFSGASPLQMAAAYAAFSNGGYYYKPTTINKIVFRNSSDEIVNEREKTKVLSDSTAYMITDVLKGVAQDIGLSSIVKGQAAAKTGTTNYDEATLKAYGYPSAAAPDGWVVGYTPNIVMAMWTGFDSNKKGVYLVQSQMTRHRNNLYNACAKAVLSDQTDKFKKPSSVVSVTVEKGTNPLMLPSANTPSSKKITELFKRGTEPTEVSTTYLLLDNPTNLNVTKQPNGVSLSWDPVPRPSNLKDTSYGDYGYKIYVNNTFIAFTTNTSYFYETLLPSGTYTVKTGFRSTDKHLSTGASVSLQESIEITFNDVNEQTLNINDPYIDPSKPITVLLDGADVTESASITKTIVNNTTGQTTEVIDTSTANTYTITYTVSYKNQTKTFTKIVKIV